MRHRVYAVLGMVMTIILACVGGYGYTSGEYIITFWGIALSQFVFWLLVLALAGRFVYLLANAFGKAKTGTDDVPAAIREVQRPAKEDGAEQLNEACEVVLTRFRSAVGAAMGVRVFLNGVEKGTIRNGGTLSMRAWRADCTLSVLYDADASTRSIRFAAKPGGCIRITLKYMGCVLTEQSEVERPAAPDARGYRRPVSAGLIAWSAVNVLVFCLGLVPLFKAIRAAKETYEDEARRDRRAALIWNIVLSAILVQTLASILVNHIG